MRLELKLQSSTEFRYCTLQSSRDNFIQSYNCAAVSSLHVTIQNPDRILGRSQRRRLHPKHKITNLNLTTARSLVDKNWGLSPSKCRYIFNSIVSPCILYASHVWAFQLKSCLSESQSVWKRSPLHRSCSRWLTKLTYIYLFYHCFIIWLVSF